MHHTQSVRSYLASLQVFSLQSGAFITTVASTAKYAKHRSSRHGVYTQRLSNSSVTRRKRLRFKIHQKLGAALRNPRKSTLEYSLQETHALESRGRPNLRTPCAHCATQGCWASETDGAAQVTETLSGAINARLRPVQRRLRVHANAAKHFFFNLSVSRFSLVSPSLRECFRRNPSFLLFYFRAVLFFSTARSRAKIQRILRSEAKKTLKSGIKNSEIVSVKVERLAKHSPLRAKCASCGTGVPRGDVRC